MPAPIPPTSTYSGLQSPDDLAALASDLNQIRAQAMKRVGATDARYIVRLLWVIRGMESAGRALLMGAPWWPTWWLGALVLGLAKCLQNMEFGHNVMHGQYNWMNDPRFDGKTHEWDLACNREDWRHTHNHMHHHYTNVLEMDRDFGYGMLRLSADVPWERRYLMQAPYALIVALLFEWAIAIHNLEVERLRTDRAATLARIQVLWPKARAKMWAQFQKDYLWWPLLGAALAWLFGANALHAAGSVALGNALANVIRNLWSFTVIFCGHFTDGVNTFEPASVQGESPGHWYLRQILGSANLRGGRLFHLLTGNLSHQIEHHLFPDLPARRYAEVAPQVQAVCARYGLPYHQGSLRQQVWSVARRIVRHSFPGGERMVTALRWPGDAQA